MFERKNLDSGFKVARAFKTGISMHFSLLTRVFKNTSP